MEYRSFGPGGVPPEQMLRELKGFVNLDDEQRKTVAEWFTQEDFDPYMQGRPPKAASSTLLPEQVDEAVSLIGYLLYLWREYDLELGDIERDLLLLGYSQKDIEKVTDVLKQLFSVRDSVWSKNYSRMQKLDGLPTVDNVNLICDARAVFGGFPEGSDSIGPAYKQLLALVPIVIMEMIFSDNYGRQERMAVQMTDEHFERFAKMISRAQEQLGILKAQIGRLNG